MYIVFDTETTGLPKSWTAPTTDIANWPEPIEVAWVVLDESFNKVKESSFLVKQAKALSPEIVELTGITDEALETEGVDMAEVFASLLEDLEASSNLVAHNIKFDKAIIEAAWHRTYPGTSCPIFVDKKSTCTMLESTPICKVPARYGSGYKWPNLTEAYSSLVNKPMEGAHRALADVLATCEILKVLRGVS